MIRWRNLLFILLYLFNHTLFAENHYILCIEGGGSKTIFQLLDKQGQLIHLIKNHMVFEQIEAPSSNINTVGKEGVKAVLHSFFDNVKIGDHSVNFNEIMPNCRIVAGMAGASLPQNQQNILLLFEECGIKREHIFLMSDAELVLHLIDEEGIILISGTGSICFGKKNNQLYRVGGLGRILGDEGSGYQIGLQALKAALAEEYGWGAPTSLTPLIVEFFQLTELKTLISKINLGEIQPSKIASSAPLVFREAQRGDNIAKEIIDHAAQDLAYLLMTQLEISHLSNCEIHLWGGIFKNDFRDEFIQKIIHHADPQHKKRLKIINQSFSNAAVIYASKFLVKPIQ